MRIAGGRLSQMPLLSPGPRVRPTMERTRETCARWFGERLVGARVVDLFAGTGALGLELVSCGARSCDFIEHGDSAMHALKGNVTTFKARWKRLTPRVDEVALRVFFRDAIPFVGGLGAGAYDIALCDPPYGSKKLDRVLEAWFRTPFATWLVLEHEPLHAFEHGGRLAFRSRIEDSVLSILEAPTSPERPAAALPDKPDNS